jgi:hypothetical protein
MECNDEHEMHELSYSNEEESNAEDTDTTPIPLAPPVVPAGGQPPSILPPISPNIQMQCNMIAGAPMVAAPVQATCYLCYSERRRHHPEFTELNKVFDGARMVFERFAVEGHDAKEAMIDSYQTYESMRKKQKTTSNSLVMQTRSKSKKPLIYPEISFADFHAHFVNHIKSRTHDTLLKNDEMNNIHNTITKRINDLNGFITTALDAKEYKVKSECFVNEMRALYMVNQIMHMPRYADINTPVKNIQKTRK